MENKTWVKALWDELNDLSDEQQIVESGELITYVTHVLLTQLSEYRCDAALRCLEKPGASLDSVAESIGSRRSVIERLVSRARADLRVKAVAAHGT